MVGTALAALVIAGCTWALGGDGMEAWGWRLPFLLSGAVAPVAAGFLGRELCGDSDDERVESARRAAQRSQMLNESALDDGCCACGGAPACVAARQHGGRVALVCLAVASSGCTSYFVSTFLPTYLGALEKESSGSRELSASEVTASTCVVTTSTMVVLPVVGRLSDALGRVGFAIFAPVFGDDAATVRFSKLDAKDAVALREAAAREKAAHMSRRHLMALGYALVAALSPVGGYLLESEAFRHDFWKVVFVELGFSCVNALSGACLAAFEVENFLHTGAAYTGVAIAHNLAMALFGGTTPAVATALYEVRPLLPFGFVSLVACVSFAALSCLPLPASPCARPPALVEKHAPLAKHRRANYDATAEEDPFLEPPPAPEPPRGIITRGAAARATAAPSWAEGYDDLAR